MLQFECPSCRKLCQAVTEYAGKLVICPQCGQSVAVPRDGAAITADPLPTPRPSVDADDDVLRGRSIVKDGGAARIWIRNGIYAIILLSVAACVIALFIPSTRRVHVVSARTQSVNNLKNIGLAFHGFHDANKHLPFNGSDADAYSAKAVKNDPRSGSWAFQILPYIDQGPLFATIDRNRGVPVFLCPGRGRPAVERSNDGGAWSDYFLNAYINDPLQAADPAAPDSRRTFVSITDGTSNTIFVGHGNIDTRQYASDADVALCSNIFTGGTTGTTRAGDNGRTNPTGVTLQRDAAAAPTVGSWGSPFPQGALMCMGDATVRMFPYATRNFSAFLTPTGGENVVVPD